MTQTVLATLVYAFNASRVLMLERAEREGDIHSGKWNGLGGKLEPGETPVEAAVRELREESGLSVDANRMHAVGTLMFPEFREKKNPDGSLTQQHWLVWIFRCDIAADAKPFVEGPEGKLHFVHKNEVFSKNLWEADREFLPYVLATPPRPFTGIAWYTRGKLTRTWIVPLEALAADGSVRSSASPSRS